MAHVRPMNEGDIEAAYMVASLAFARSEEEVLNRAPEEVEARLARHRMGLKTDPDGCFVAEDGGRVVGVSKALLREGLWILSLLVVEEEYRASGVGRDLIEAALAYGGDFSEGMIASSTHPAAMRTYANAGFVLHPTFTAKGKIRCDRISPTPNVRGGGPDDLELAAEVDRYLRGAAHGPDLEFMSATEKMLVADGAEGKGYAAVGNDGISLLGATSEKVASELLWACLGSFEEGKEVEVRWITARQDWAVRVVHAAGLDLHLDGPICVKGNPGPLAPYIPSGPFL